MNKSITTPIHKSQNKVSLFRELTYREKQPVEVYDFRNITQTNPNNNLIITCEHASNNTHSYKIPKNELKWLDSHWGYDIGARDICLEIAEKSETLSVLSNFSRLIIDPNRTLLSNSLIRKSVEINVDLSFNHDDIVDRETRIVNFYLPYMNILKETLDFIEPRYHLSVHSFTKSYEDLADRNFEVGVLFREKGEFSDRIEHAYKKEGINYKVNEPYNPGEGVCHVLDSILTHRQPDCSTNIEAVMLEYRNDYASDSKFRKKQAEILKDVIKTLH